MPADYLPVFYARCFNEPYTEGHIQILRLMLRSLESQNIQCRVFNYKYGSEGLTKAPPSNVMDTKIPVVSRDDAISVRDNKALLLTMFFEAIKLPTFLRAEKQISKKNPIINITNCFRYPRLLMKKINGSRIVTHVYMQEEHSSLDSLLGYSDLFIVSSNTISKHLHSSLGVSKEKIKIIHPPVDTDFYQPTQKQKAREILKIPFDAPIILYIGNLTPLRFPASKILQIMGDLQKEHPKATLQIFTSPSISNRQHAVTITNQASLLGLTDVIRIEHRNLSDIEKSLLYSASDLFLFPSASGAFAVEPPLTVLEAMSCGLPIVSSDVLSLNEFISSGSEGFILPSDAEPALWGQKIDQILSSDALTEVGLAARKKVMLNSSIRVVGKKLIAAYEELCV
jgi:glycosyltransferase involved in cell wall biosynthesis